MYAVERMVTHLKTENQSIASVRDNLQAQLNDLCPKYAALQQAKKNVTATGVLGTIALAMGGALISVAGLFVTDVWKFFLSGGGAVLVISGCILFAVMHRWGWPQDS